MKIIENTEYSNFWSMFFRQDNIIRFLGALIPIGAYFLTETSQVELMGINAKSDVLFFAIGVAVMILGPDIRKIVVNRFAK